MLFSEIASIVGGVPLQSYGDETVKHLLTDSRKLSEPSGTVFFAITGERHDSHQLIDQLYAKGVRCFVIEKQLEYALANATIVKVDSSINALQEIATTHRKQFDIPVIGITGSNGKTIVKEWLSQLLAPDLAIIANPGSYNSQIGVPLSVWNMAPHHQLGVFEAGISQPKEMERLAKIIDPTIGLFTNIGAAHDEGFESEEEKVKEKCRLFQHANIILYCADQSVVNDFIIQSGLPHLSWGFSSSAAIKIEKVDESYRVRYNTLDFRLVMPFHDIASIENCLHCVATLLYFNVAPQSIQARIKTLRSVAMRLEMKEGINHCQLIDDSYNNDLNGLQTSLDFLKHQHQKNKKRLILSDILQSGLSEKSLCSKIESLITNSDIDSFIGIGPILSNHASLFSNGASFYRSTEDFLEAFNTEMFHNELILIKGARSFSFEKIVRLLQRKVHGTVMEVDLNALVYNLNFFRSKLQPHTKIMVMVKALAYGSGSVEIANLLSYHKVDYLGVAYANEGIDLRENNITIPIMVMNPSEENFDQLIQHNLEPEIYNLKMLTAFINHAQQKPAKIHIKLDTGMVRLGFSESELPMLITLLQQTKTITVASIFSHLAGADDSTHDAFTRHQGEQFFNWASTIVAAIGYKPDFHLVNSSGILRFPQFHFDMVRLGIGLYGVDPTELHAPLQPVVTLKTTISQIKRIGKGESVGYGRSAMATRDMVIATLAIGYADGFARAFSNGVGEVLINGKYAPVFGRVCMDMTMVDITDIEALEGDTAIVFGQDLAIEEVAKKINTIPYEIMTNTSERVRRVFIAESI